MRKFNFTKMVASGNDFILILKENLSALRIPLSILAKSICERRFGIGADGILVLAKSKVANIKMRIFNADGSEAQMCGNGARCVALYTKEHFFPNSSKITIETKAGIIKSEIKKDLVKIKLTDPKNIKLNLPLKVNGRLIRVNFINTGVPHTVIFTQGLEKIDVKTIGRAIRYHQKFKPAGTNVDFVEVLKTDLIKIRTYERGVEDETLACGTGAVASALITNYRLLIKNCRCIYVKTYSGEVLKVYFERKENTFKNVWLEGKAKIIYKGEYYV